MFRFVRFLSRDERGVSALEYSVLAGIVVVAVAAAGAIFGGNTGLPALFNNMITHVTSVQTNGH
jgi:pilus assembly protein Flp/PilA